MTDPDDRLTLKIGQWFEASATGRFSVTLVTVAALIVAAGYFALLLL